LSEGASTLADQDTITLNFGTQARADWRALISAAFIGSGVGLSLGAAYMAGGMGTAVADHNRVERIVEAAAGALPESALRQGMEPGVQALTKASNPFGQGATTRAANPFGAPSLDAAQAAVAQASRARELECMTQAVYFEARGESARGQAAVATVIMNRVKNPSFPKTVCGVVYQGASHHNGCQFSFACDGMVERVAETTAWSRARQVAARALSGVLLRDVGSATHFHTTDVSPQWGSRMLRVAQVGLHVFYRFNPHAPRDTVRDDDDAPVFTSARLSAAPQMRLAAAVVAPTANAAAKPAAPTTAASKAEPAPRIELSPAPLPIARTETSKADSAATS
jgi:spore germination cell wall hydrolase CwlJ-like protein